MALPVKMLIVTEKELNDVKGDIVSLIRAKTSDMIDVTNNYAAEPILDGTGAVKGVMIIYNDILYVVTRNVTDIDNNVKILIVQKEGSFFV